MSMFGGPGVALGVGALTVWSLRWLLPDAPFRKWILTLVPAALALALLFPWLRVYVTVPATPVLSKPHALALTRLAELSPPNSQVVDLVGLGLCHGLLRPAQEFRGRGETQRSPGVPPGVGPDHAVPLAGEPGHQLHCRRI